MLILIAIFVPIISLLYQEKIVLSDRRLASYELHDELQEHLWSDSISAHTYSKMIQSKSFHFNFTVEEELLKGCVTWENVRKTEETFCLYGISKK